MPGWTRPGTSRPVRKSSSESDALLAGSNCERPHRHAVDAPRQFDSCTARDHVDVTPVGGLRIPSRPRTTMNKHAGHAIRTCAEHRGLSTRSERPQNRKRNHPRSPLLETNRVDGVKASQHRWTPISYHPRLVVLQRIKPLRADRRGHEVDDGLVALVAQLRHGPVELLQDVVERVFACTITTLSRNCRGSLTRRADALTATSTASR